jgi:hypothetical protein
MVGAPVEAVTLAEAEAHVTLPERRRHPTASLEAAPDTNGNLDTLEQLVANIMVQPLSVPGLHASGCSRLGPLELPANDRRRALNEGHASTLNISGGSWTPPNLAAPNRVIGCTSSTRSDTAFVAFDRATFPTLLTGGRGITSGDLQRSSTQR